MARLHAKPLDIEVGRAEVYRHVGKYSVLGINWQEGNFNDRNKPTDA